MASVKQEKIAKFRPQRRNLNKHKQRGMSTLETSMRKLGYVAPMTAAADGEIIDGSARLETSAIVFDDDVLVIHHDGTKPVIMVRDDIASADSPEAREISIAANRVAQLNLDWDVEQLLADAQAKLDLQGLFEQSELDAMLAELTPPMAGSDTEPQIDKAEELRQKWGVESGQLWQLGQHRLICGDCTDKSTVERLMGQEKASTLVFDPEWDHDVDAPTGFDSVLAFGDGSTLGKTVALYGSPTWLFVWDCVSCWYTPNRPLRRMKLCAWYGDVSKYNFDGWHYGDAGEERTVWNSRGEYKFKPDPRGKHLADVYSQPITKLHAESEHSHSKPLDWITMLVANCATGDIYDPFLGSGTTLIAAHNLNRRCFGAEISPAYCGVILQRFFGHTGIQPQLIA